MPVETNQGVKPPVFVDDAEDIYQNASCAYFSSLPDGSIVKVNKTFLEWTGYTEAEVLGGMRFHDFFTLAGRIFYQTHFVPLLSMLGYVREIEFEIRAKDGTRFPVLVNSKNRFAEDGSVQVCRTTLFRADERISYEQELLLASQRAERASIRSEELNLLLVDANIALHEKSQRLQVTLNAISDGVFATDTKGIITFANPIACRMVGRHDDAVAGQPWARVFPMVDAGEDGQAVDPVRQMLDGSSVEEADHIYLVRGDGTTLPVHISAALIRDEANAVVGVITVMHDISSSVEMAEKMRYLATHDALTGLVNRSEFERRLQAAIDSTAGDGLQHSLLYIDLDQFKIVNDTCGHAAGDNLLGQISVILRRELRQDDTLARLGGDEFGVLLRGCARDDALRIANLIRTTIYEFRFAWQDKVFPIGVSIGLVCFSGIGLTLPDLMRMADSACFVAKDLGRNRVHVYESDDKAVQRQDTEMGWVGRIRRALDEDRLVLYAQRIAALAAGAGIEEHYEVLVRMHGEDGEIVMPMSFIPAAERYGLMPLIDRWVISNTFAHYRRALDAGEPHRVYAINLSGGSVCDESLLEFIVAQFEVHRIAPQDICFEITETSAIANLPQASAIMRELKTRGCSFALDDFGSGMSSFRYLKLLPVDFLKIDGCFVRDLLEDPVDRAMVECINQVGHMMGIRTVAEFVESEGIKDLLATMGVDFAQGYAVSPPQPLVPATWHPPA